MGLLGTFLRVEAFPGEDPHEKLFETFGLYFPLLPPTLPGQPLPHPDAEAPLLIHNVWLPVLSPPVPLSAA